MDKQLRIIAGSVVVESKLSKSAKTQIINFIQQEATDVQIKALLMDGKIVQLDEQSEEIVNARFEQHPLNEGGWKTVFGMFLLGPGGWIIYRAIRAALSEKSKRCGILGIGRERDVCLWKAKAEEATKMAALISREMKNCTNAKNPEKCKAAGVKQIAQNKAKAAKFLQKIKHYGSKSIKKGTKAQAGVKKAKDKSTKVF